MMRSLTIALVLMSSVAFAQRAGDGAKKSLPVDPYAEPKKPAAPDDPYADPAPVDKPAAKPVAKKPAKAAPDDPYADPAPVEKPAEKPADRPAAKPVAKKPAKAVPDDPYADPAPVEKPADKPVARPPAKKPAKAAPDDPYADPTPPAKKPGAPADPYALPEPVTPVEVPQAIPARVGISDLTAVQGLLAVQRLDGWLLFDRDGENPIALRLVKPEGSPTRPWFYLLPAKGEPVALVPSAGLRSFGHLAGPKLVHSAHRRPPKPCPTPPPRRFRVTRRGRLAR